MRSAGSYPSPHGPSYIWVVLLTPLPAERFDVALRLSCRVDAKARIGRPTIRCRPVTPPAVWRCGLGATNLTVYHGAAIIA